MSGSPDDIVGHKTIDTGEICPETGFPKMRHEPLTRAEGDALWQSVREQERLRAERMPDEQAAIRALWDAHQRLKELGWKEPQYCPKDGTRFRVIELGSTGIFDCSYNGKWPDGHYMVSDGNDLYPTSSGVAMYRLFPEDEVKEKARLEEAKRRYADSTHEWFIPSGVGFECCQSCGIVRRADRKNKICRGPVHVGLRDTPSPVTPANQGNPKV